MNTALRSSRRLVKRGEAGLACDEDGVSLGAVNLVSASADAGGVRRCAVRSPDEISNVLRTGYGPQPPEVVSRLHRGLLRTAAWIESGDFGRAGVEALMLRLPDLTPEAMRKLDKIADLEKRNTAWETEPRITSGQAGGGQWTTNGGAGTTRERLPAQSVSAANYKPSPSPPSPCTTTNETSSSSNASDLHGPDRSFLIHVSTAAIPANGFGVGQDFALPNWIARLGSVGLLAYLASLLNKWDAAVAREQISNAIKRFGLDPNRPGDVIAASAYVWSNYNLPFLHEVPATGPGLEAASQAVMRFVMANPGAFTSMNQRAVNLITMAALGGLSDFISKSQARPQNVDPALQTRSKRARAAIALNLLSGKWAAHHLVPVSVSKANADIALLAKEVGWKADLASNLIGLPRDANTQLGTGEILPLHSGPHPNYSRDTAALIAYYRSTYPYRLSPIQAKSILESVADFNRARILYGYYNPAIKVGQ